MTNLQQPTITAHTWGRGRDDEQSGALIYLGRRDIFVPRDDIPTVIAKLQAVHALTA